MKTTLLLLFFACSTALAGWKDIPSSDFEVKAPPAQGSAAYLKDFEKLLEYQKTRTRAQCRLAERQKWPNYKSLFGYTEILDSEDFELTKPLLTKVISFTQRVSVYHKGKFERPRPYDVNEKVKPCVEKPTGSKSYPSTHATIAYAAACVLAAIFPEKESDLQVYGQELGDLRFIVGVHHPSDVKAGQELGQDICDRLKSEPDFLEEIETLKNSAAISLE